MPDEKKELRKIPRDELIQILYDHPKWVESWSKEGRQADLSYTDFREIDLSDLLPKHKAWLESGGSEGKQANLKLVDLHGADLSDADLFSDNGTIFSMRFKVAPNLEE